MPMWHTNMTAEDYERNKREWIEEKRREAKQMRARAQELIERANEIDPDMELSALLREAAKRELTEDEIKAQRESWVRANMPTGDPRFD